MIKIPLARSRKYIGLTAFKWGVYFQLRWNYRWWHLKLACWMQRGLRVSTRRQTKLGKRKRYVTAVRFNVSYWWSTYGRERRPFNCGFMLYAGNTTEGGGGSRAEDA